MIVQHFANGDYQTFSQLVEQEYRKFLLVRRVESLVAEGYNHNKKDNKLREQGYNENDDLGAWRQPCRPNELVDLFWQTHISQTPQLYQSYCNDLIGQIIVRPSSSNNNANQPRTTAPNDMDRKAVLFRFEKQASPIDDHLNDCLLFLPTFNPYKVIGEMRRRQGRLTPDAMVGFE